MQTHRYTLGNVVAAEMLRPRVTHIRFDRVLSPAEFKAYLDETLAIVRDRPAGVSIIEFTPKGTQPRSNRELQRAFFAEHAGLFRSKTMGMAFIAHDIPGWLALNGFFLVSPPQWAYLVARNLDEALTWAEHVVEAQESGAGVAGMA